MKGLSKINKPFCFLSWREVTAIYRRHLPIHRARSIADQYLEERRRFLLDSAEFTLGAILKEVLEEKEVLYPQVRKWIQRNLAPAAMKRPLNMNGVNLASVVSNLIQNSIDALFAKSTDVSKNISLTAIDNRDNISFVIEDTGGGMSCAALDAVKTKRAFTSKQNGNGIGLRSVIDQVTVAGGNVQISNDGCAGRGIRIMVDLPAKQSR